MRQVAVYGESVIISVILLLWAVDKLARNIQRASHWFPNGRVSSHWRIPCKMSVSNIASWNMCLRVKSVVMDSVDPRHPRRNTHPHRFSFPCKQKGVVFFFRTRCTLRAHVCYSLVCSVYIRADSRFAPSQWETALHCNDVPHWLGASLESALYMQPSSRTECHKQALRSLPVDIVAVSAGNYELLEFTEYVL